MKPIKFLALTALALPFLPGIALAQGPLTPPGAPAPTMKTLDQVEPRTALTGGVYAITQPGSYYLAAPMQAVSIDADNVTLDLMGFAIAATGGSAIYFYGTHTNVVIRNGTISSSIGNGVQYASSTAHARGLVEGIRVMNASIGMNLPGGFLVRNCQVHGCSQVGIKGNGALEVENCLIQGNATGLSLTNGSRAAGNTVAYNTGEGILLRGTNSILTGNIVKGNSDNYDLAPGNQLNLLLCDIPETLDWPCSVTLAGTLASSSIFYDGIWVTADNVTIDMAGHSLIGPGATGLSGIYQGSDRRNLRVFNGKAINWTAGSQAGFNLNGAGNILEDLQATGNEQGFVLGAGGAMIRCVAVSNQYAGISAGDGSTLSDCLSRENTTGIAASSGNALIGCTAQNNAGFGFSVSSAGVLRNCVAHNNGNTGIFALDGCSIEDCVAYLNDGDGFAVTSGNSLSDCVAQFNDGDGIEMNYANRVADNICDRNGFTSDGAGIYALGGGNRIEGNFCTDNDRGIDVDAAGNFIVRNTCSGNTTNWVVAVSNVCLVVNAALSSSAISGDSGGTTPGSADPSANFTH